MTGINQGFQESLGFMTLVFFLLEAQTEKMIISTFNQKDVLA